MRTPEFPLGVPLNRPKPPGLKPVPGRPNWWQDPKGGEPVYIEPPRRDDDTD